MSLSGIHTNIIGPCSPPSDQRCIKNVHHCVKDIATWFQEHVRKSFAVNTVCRYIFRAKRTSHINSTQKTPCRWTDTKWRSVLWSDESIWKIVFGNHGRYVVRVKKEKKTIRIVISAKFKSHHRWYVSSYGRGNLQICDGTIHAEGSGQALKQHPSRLFCRDLTTYFSKTTPSQTAVALNQECECKTSLPAVQTCPRLKTCAALLSVKQQWRTRTIERLKWHINKNGKEFQSFNN